MTTAARHATRPGPCEPCLLRERELLATAVDIDGSPVYAANADLMANAALLVAARTLAAGYENHATAVAAARVRARDDKRAIARAADMSPR